MGTELRDGVRHKNAKRWRMLNEQHRDEAVEEKAFKECRGGVKATPLQLSLVLPSVAVFPVLPSLSSSLSEVDFQHKVRTQARDFPLAPTPKKSQQSGQKKKEKRSGGLTCRWRDEEMKVE